MAHQTVAIEVAMSTFNRKRQIMKQKPSTQDEIIEMAMEAEFVSHSKPSEEESELFVCTDKDIVRFYNLVAAKEREACAKLCEQEQEAVRYWKEQAQGMQRDYDLLLADYEKLAQRTWVGLTDVEIEQAIELISMLHGDYATEVAYAIEAKLKERNT